MLNEKTSKELKEMAKELKIKGWWDMKKIDLIKAIEETNTNTNKTEENATEVENQAQKKHHKREYTYNNKTQNLTQWAKELNMPVQTLYGRLILKKWPVEKAFTKPVKRGKDMRKEDEGK